MKLTKHAILRAKQRMGLNEHSLERIAEKALKEGIPRNSLKGRLRKYVDSLWLAEKNSSNVRLWSEYAFLFTKSGILITILSLPNEMKNYKQYIKK